jgi:hypothetical protein
MGFTDEELARISSWVPIAPGFDRGGTTVEAYIHPILAKLSENRRIGLRVTQDGGMANYFGFLVFDATVRPPGSAVRGVRCVAVQLSLMAPVGVFGPSTFSESELFFGWSNLEPEQVLDPLAQSDWAALAVVGAVHEVSPYRLVGREVTDRLLPPGIVINEYCLCAEPWNRVFHALFADSD